VPPPTLLGLVQEQRSLLVNIEVVSPPVILQCRPEGNMHVNPVIRPIIFFHQSNHVRSCFIKLLPGEVFIFHYLGFGILHSTRRDPLVHSVHSEGSTILLASRTMLGECCLAAIQPKGFWTRLRAQERERECVCVCEREREGE